MNRIFLKFSVIICAALFLCGEGCWQKFAAAWGIWVKNDSDKEVYFIIGLDKTDGYFYPTTQLPNTDYNMRLVKPGQETPINYPPSVVKCSDNPIAVFVLDPDTVAKYTWEQLRENENFLAKYEFTCKKIPNEIIFP